ncbi:MAG: chemotaxis protein CheW [Piscirickettsiaceae bacterium]|nr:chemotaxis protein CheW [Piscirickettsiaceae bacterium]
MSEVEQVVDAFTVNENEEDTEQYLTFVLGEEEYGVEILRVQEMKAWDNVTNIPNTPHYLCGVLNHRGTIVPIVDLRRRFDMPVMPYTATTVVIVLNVEGVTNRIVGIVVDGVSDTHDVLPDDIRSVPDFGSQIDTQYISGLVPIGDKMMMILNIDYLLSVEAIG